MQHRVTIIDGRVIPTAKDIETIVKLGHHWSPILGDDRMIPKEEEEEKEEKLTKQQLKERYGLTEIPGPFYAFEPRLTTLSYNPEEEEGKRGKFIVIDGIDGVGKTEQCKLATSYIFDRCKGNEVFLTREPTKNATSIKEEMIRAGGDPKDKGSFYVSQFVADRGRHLAEKIIPALKAGVHVVCDRYKYSTFAFQSQQGIDMDFIHSMHLGMQVPDLVIILDCPASIAKERRETSKEGVTTVFDKASVDLTEEYRKVYLSLPLYLKEEPIYIVDASKSKEEVSKEIQDMLDKMFPKKE